MVDRAESDRLRDRKIAAEISFKLRFADFSALLYSLLLLLSRFSRVRLCVTLWTAAYQAPPSMGFSRQEYWSGVQLYPLGVANRKKKKTSILQDCWNAISTCRLGRELYVNIL